MSNTLFNYVYNIRSNANNVMQDMNKLKGGVDSVGVAVNKTRDEFGRFLPQVKKDIALIKFDALLNQFQRVNDGIKSLNGPGMDFNANMKELEAMTGVTGAKLDEIGANARKAGVDFGTGAAGGVESYKLLLSQLTPEIAKQPKALAEMGKSVGITSKLMAGDTAAATEVLTTAMNQYGISTEDPLKASEAMAKMMNVMAASAAEGSAELPAIKAALEQSGMAAKAAGVSFEETNASIQVLDKAGKKGSEGGVALRNVMATLGQGRFLPKQVQEELINAGVNVRKLTDTSIPLADRLKALKPIMNDSALVSALFGKENNNAALALMQGIPEIERLTTAVTGTNTAQEQASKIMESQEEKNKRLQAQIDNFKISIFEATNGASGYANVLGQVAMDIGNLMPLMSGAVTVVKTLTSAQKMQAIWTSIVSGATAVWTGIQAAFNAVMAMNPIVLVVLAVAALVAAIVIVAKKTEGWGAMWQHTVNGAKLIFKAYVESVKLYFTVMVNGLMMGINLIMKKWYEFKNATGLDNKDANNAAIAKINADTEARKKAIVDGAKKVADLTKASAAEFSAGFKSVKWKKEDKTEESANPVQGLLGGGGGKGTSGSGGSGLGSKTNAAIATGGTKHNYITIKIDELVGLKANTVSGGKDGAQQAGQGLKDELIRVLAMATTAAD